MYSKHFALDSYNFVMDRKTDAPTGPLLRRSCGRLRCKKKILPIFLRKGLEALHCNLKLHPELNRKWFELESCHLY